MQANMPILVLILLRLPLLHHPMHKLILFVRGKAWPIITYSNMKMMLTTRNINRCLNIIIMLRAEFDGILYDGLQHEFKDQQLVRWTVSRKLDVRAIVITYPYNIQILMDIL